MAQQHYLLEQKSESDLATAYPHDPESLLLSTQDYLEDKVAGGWDLIEVRESGPPIYIFRPNSVTV